MGSFAALLVGLDPELTTACTVIFKAAGLSAAKAAHVAAALERIPVLQPFVVVLPAAMKADASESLSDRTVAVGSEVVWLEPGISRSDLTALLTKAADDAFARAR
jgi:hypothetical protein